MENTIEIPEGYEARIKGNKVIFEPKESEDERIRKELIGFIQEEIDSINRLVSGDYDDRDADDIAHQKWCKKALAWLEKQGEQKLDGTFVNVDDVREDFVNEVYRVLDSDPNNDRANQIIEAFDSLPTLKLERQGSQNLANSAKTCKVEPKFKVGDKITEKDFDECGCGTIIDIKDGKYIFDNGGFVCIEEQGLWQLVEQKPVDKDELFDRRYAQHLVENQRQKSMIQWKGDNLKEVIDFTGKDRNFDKWFKSFEEYEQYVQKHNGIFKLFNTDGSHYEVPVGAWIVKTPDGYNVASKAIFKQNPAWSKEDEEMLRRCISATFDHGYLKECDWLKSFKERYIWTPSDEQIIELERACAGLLFDQDIILSLYNDLKKLKG